MRLTTGQWKSAVQTLQRKVGELKAEIATLRSEGALQAENTKLREMINILTDVENEDPGCLECAKRKDELAAPTAKSAWDVANEGYWQYKTEHVITPLIERYNKMHDEVFSSFEKAEQC